MEYELIIKKNKKIINISISSIDDWKKCDLIMQFSSIILVYKTVNYQEFNFNFVSLHLFRFELFLNFFFINK